MDEHTLNDLLECSVCLERLDTTSKVLPCQHTFCRKCLEIIVASHNELRCPECRVLIEIKIDNLPPNVLLMRILGGMKIAQTNQTENPGPLAVQSQNAEESNTLSVANPSAGIPPIQNILPQLISNNFRPNQLQASTKRVPNSISIPHARALFDYSAKENG